MKKVYFFVLLTSLCFSTMELAGKIGGNSLNSLQFTFLRFMLGVIVLIPLVVRERRESDYKITLKDILIMVVSGMILVPGSMYICQVGITHCNASTASVIIATNGMFTMVWAHFIGGEHFTKQRLCYLMIAILGLVFLMCPWDIAPGNTLLGVALCLIGAITFGLYTVMGKLVSGRTGPITQATVSMFSGAVCLLPIMAVTGTPLTAGIADNIPIILFAGIFVTGCGYFALFTTIRLSNASTSAISFFLKIVIAPLLNVIFLRETLAWNTYTGIALVLLSSFLNLSAQAKARRS